MENNHFNERLRQIALLVVIIAIAVLLLSELSVFFPGLLGAITVFILSRSYFYRAVAYLKWKNGLVALLFIFLFLILIAVPVYLSVLLISPKINAITSQQTELLEGARIIAEKIKKSTGLQLLTADNAKSVAEKLSSLIPQLLNGTAMMLANLLMMFFVYYYLLVNGQKAETYLNAVIPLRRSNISLLAEETKMMVKANAIGIPLICIIQGLVAAIGYRIFGIEDWLLWGFFTGLFAFFPLVGTMIIWVPLVAYLFAVGNYGVAAGVCLYSFLVTGNVDTLARITILKRIGDVHPLITVLGVIVGLNLFGFIGLIFGPLLVSYCWVLIKIYDNEFINRSAGSEKMQ